MKDIDEIRRNNLRRLEIECGSPTAAAHLLDMSGAQFTNLRDGAKDSKTGRRRGMRKETARRIEKAAGKPAGWLDVDHDDVSPTPTGIDLASVSPEARAVIEAIVKADRTGAASEALKLVRRLFPDEGDLGHLE
jgi:hypothetical protein